MPAGNSWASRRELDIVPVADVDRVGVEAMSAPIAGRARQGECEPVVAEAAAHVSDRGLAGQVRGRDAEKRAAAGRAVEI
jgi:hypothetical protein